MTGTLYLLPNTLSYHTEFFDQDVLDMVIPVQVQTLIARLSYFVVEQPKTIRAFLKKIHQRHPPRLPLQAMTLHTLHAQTPESVCRDLLQPILAGEDGGLLAEAGVPAVADPGARLVRLAHDLGLRVSPQVGPCALLLALMASGLQGQNFVFHGYLPQAAPARAQKISTCEAISGKMAQTQLWIETPYRNVACFQAFMTVCAPRTRLCLACDLSLPSEYIKTQEIAAWRRYSPDAIFSVLHKRPAVFLLLASR